MEAHESRTRRERAEVLGWTPGVPSGVHRARMMVSRSRDGQGPNGPVLRASCRYAAWVAVPTMPGMIGRAANPYDRSAVPCRLLLVSDRQAASEALRTHLAHHGFTIVAHEGSAAGAADAARREHPEVVLIDAAVPGGWQDVVVALSGLIPRDHIAVLAAYWSTDARRAATRTGIGATLLKRVEGVELVNRLRALAGVA